MSAAEDAAADFDRCSYCVLCFPDLTASGRLSIKCSGCSRNDVVKRFFRSIVFCARQFLQVETALVQQDELSIDCKQDIQTVLAGYDQKGSQDQIPELPNEVGILRHRTAISISAVVVALFIFFLRVLWRHRQTVAVDSARKKANKKKASKQVKNKVK